MNRPGEPVPVRKNMRKPANPERYVGPQPGQDPAADPPVDLEPPADEVLLPLGPKVVLKKRRAPPSGSARFASSVLVADAALPDPGPALVEQQVQREPQHSQLQKDADGAGTSGQATRFGAAAAANITHGSGGQSKEALVAAAKGAVAVQAAADGEAGGPAPGQGDAAAAASLAVGGEDAAGCSTSEEQRAWERHARLPGWPPGRYADPKLQEDLAALANRPNDKVVLVLDGFVSEEWARMMPKVQGLKGSQEEVVVPRGASVLSLQRQVARLFDCMFWPEMAVLVDPVSKQQLFALDEHGHKLKLAFYGVKDGTTLLLRIQGLENQAASAAQQTLLGATEQQQVEAPAERSEQRQRLGGQRLGGQQVQEEEKRLAEGQQAEDEARDEGEEGDGEEEEEEPLGEQAEQQEEIKARQEGPGAAEVREQRHPALSHSEQAQQASQKSRGQAADGGEQPRPRPQQQQQQQPRKHKLDSSAAEVLQHQVKLRRREAGAREERSLGEPQERLQPPTASATGARAAAAPASAAAAAPAMAAAPAAPLAAAVAGPSNGGRPSARQAPSPAPLPMFEHTGSEPRKPSSRFWSADETQALLEGIHKHQRAWKAIETEFKERIGYRTDRQCKERWDNLKKGCDQGWRDEKPKVAMPLYIKKMVKALVENTPFPWPEVQAGVQAEEEEIEGDDTF